VTFSPPCLCPAAGLIRDSGLAVHLVFKDAPLGENEEVPEERWPEVIAMHDEVTKTEMPMGPKKDECPVCATPYFMMHRPAATKLKYPHPWRPCVACDGYFTNKIKEHYQQHHGLNPLNAAPKLEQGLALIRALERKFKENKGEEVSDDDEIVPSSVQGDEVDQDPLARPASSMEVIPESDEDESDNEQHGPGTGVSPCRIL
jgi:hypothetical protein